MQDRIEPPILMSRLMTFVLATSLVVLTVLVWTLDKMFPLNRPQVFFLTSQMMDDQQLTLTEIPKDNLELYKQQFIKEYIRARNEIEPNLSIMRARWANNADGIVKTWSNDDVFGKFTETEMFNIINQDLTEVFDIKCVVEFPLYNSVIRAVNSDNADTYSVHFQYNCKYGPLGDQSYVQEYIIRVQLEPGDESSVKWAERMENPLGIRVSGYDVIDAQNKVLNTDPLNWSGVIQE